VRKEGHWCNLQARLLAADDRYVWFEVPPVDDPSREHHFIPNESVALSFKLKHHKYLFTSRVVAVERQQQGEGPSAWLVQVARPDRLQRLSRRTFERVDVPENRIVRASFWPGGRDAEPAGGEHSGPVFMGNVLNISAGGFSVRTARDAEQLFEVGYMVGVRLVFGTGEQTVYADAQCRHITPEGDTVVLGFQFVGLGYTAAGREALRTIGSKVSEFQRMGRESGARSPFSSRF